VTSSISHRNETSEGVRPGGRGRAISNYGRCLYFDVGKRHVVSFGGVPGLLCMHNASPKLGHRWTRVMILTTQHLLNQTYNHFIVQF
jgi:hypothetical protein